jgi:hypothetical protein
MLRTQCPAGQDIFFTFFIDIDAELQVANCKSDTVAWILSSSRRLNPLIEIVPLNYSIKIRLTDPWVTGTLYLIGLFLIFSPFFFFLLQKKKQKNPEIESLGQLENCFSPKFSQAQSVTRVRQKLSV